jgi:outer membrane scaffolding protein for murein synthesis (MipA/OmpV family)
VRFSRKIRLTLDQHAAALAAARKSLVLPGLLALFAATPALLPHAAHAQTIEEEALEQRGFGQEAEPGKWSVNLGAGLGEAPTYLGANSYRARLIPFALINYGNLLFLGPMGLGINVINQDGLRAGPILGFVPGRNPSDDPHLTGLGDIAPSVAAGVFATYRSGPFRISGTLREAITHTDNGVQGLVQADMLIPTGDRKLVFSFGPELEFANATYEQTWFGVSAQQSAQSGLPAYSLGAGVRDIGLHANLSYLYSTHVILRGFVNDKELIGDTASSPIVESKNQLTLGVGAAYHF